MIRFIVMVLFGVLALTVKAQTHVQDLRSAASILNSQFSILNSNKRLFDTYFLEAMLQRQKGNADAAFDLLNRCLEIDSTASEAYFFLGMYYTDMKQQERALQYFQKASRLSPDMPIYLETLAQSYISQNQYAQAIDVVERLYQIDKSRQDLLETLSRLYIRENQFDKAITTLERMEAIDGKNEKLSLAKSSLYLQSGNHEAAIKEVKDLAEQYPNDLNYRTLYANTLLMDEQREEAHKILLDVLREEPNNYRAQLTMRTYYLGLQDTLRADSLTHSILLNPHSSMEDKISLLRQEIGHNENTGGDSTQVLKLFHEMLAQPDPSAEIAEFCAAYMSMKKMPRDSIEHMLEYVLQLAPDNASARLQLVQYAWEAEDDERIISLCKAARQYNPDEMAFYYFQGMAYYRQDDHDNALDAFQNGISVITDESDPAIVSDFYAVLGDLLHQKGEQKRAFEAYDSCLQWKPDNIGCLNNYAYYLSELGQQLDRAEHMSQMTIKAEPKNPTYLDTYAWILFMQKRYAEARIYIDQAIQHDETKSAVLLEHAGDIYSFCNEPATALDYWQRALEGDPDNKVLKKKVKKKKYINK